jgi:hypothetical protein
MNESVRAGSDPHGSRSHGARRCRGGCPCGTVLWEAELDLRASPAHESSVWQRTVAARAFRLLRGGESLRGYQYFDHSAHHFFCVRCGVHAYSHRLDERSEMPAAYTVDLRCLQESLGANESALLSPAAPAPRTVSARDYELSYHCR